MSLKWHPVRKLKKGNSYCGPAVVSILTGVNTDEAARVIRSCGYRLIVKASSTGEITRTLEKFGLQCHLRPWGDFLINYARKPGTFLVLYRHHWAIVGNGKYVCSHHREPFPVEGPTPPSRVINWKAPVTYVREVTGELSGTRPAEMQKKKAQPMNPGKVKVTRLAKAWGIDCSQDTTYSMIYVNTGRAFSYRDEELDPYHGDHFAADWEEAKERVERYIRELTSANSTPIIPV